jgi:hypothetical protein
VDGAGGGLGVERMSPVLARVTFTREQPRDTHMVQAVEEVVAQRLLLFEGQRQTSLQQLRARAAGDQLTATAASTRGPNGHEYRVSRDEQKPFGVLNGGARQSLLPLPAQLDVGRCGRCCGGKKIRA